MGTTTLFATLNVIDGTIIGRNMQRHCHQEFTRFFNAVEKQVPAGKIVHAIVDNYPPVPLLMRFGMHAAGRAK